jgi:hypothetical protein
MNACIGRVCVKPSSNIATNIVKFKIKLYQWGFKSPILIDIATASQ